ncbi:DUF4079 family protein [Pseudodesulfovibrio piezophilus]|uniref:DUF4079 domain-containing protein n=1 Tax=Pseudodesulfovibrio piezophilus (strain DSM 21447 / JCM 15486 / C1TLV30) TaxID=1322246 RepID=M1WST0_PSEP2|nr:DUF4079 family protein [Pseudodesulfovibrio piezophilus]CCH49082.1 conserved membrane protein of unknown function [Pseudodesulfovibrio piezophilus C1TLV30]
MLWFHPALQIFATLVGLYAASLGMKRFLARHFEMRTRFPWKRHVTVGQIALSLWLLGMIGGMTVARLKWEVNFVTGAHYKTAFAMLPLLILGGASGLYMDKKKARRKILPLAHAACNLILLALALWQFRTGFQVIKDFIL